MMYLQQGGMEGMGLQVPWSLGLGAEGSETAFSTTFSQLKTIAGWLDQSVPPSGTEYVGKFMNKLCTWKSIFHRLMYPVN